MTQDPEPVPAPDIQADKSKLRREMRRRRRELSADQRYHHGRAMSRVIAALPLFRNSSRIALFMATDGEMDPAALTMHAHAMRKQVFLPVLVGTPRRPGLRFVRHEPGEALVSNRFGIPEPLPDPGRVISPRFLDLVMAPLVAFDDHGNRLGMGGGYYDRTFEFLRLRKRWRKPHLIGVAYEFQRLPALPRASWDVPLGEVVTEAGFRVLDG
ncbi:MAG TPA: 5-formyltetrahydrofolate cyclo-ligase [Gammaproteobacteria bacterium]|nr:5-formyltetrahydrofolate cyclo-ligase [Gammaproteobacteria bacterium]